MRILIDIVHLGDLNFYYNSINILKKENEIVLTVLERGNLVDIVKSNFPDLNVIPLGKHRKSRLNKIIGVFVREISFFFLFLKQRFDRVSSFGFYPAIAAKLFGIKSVLFHDDYEYKLMFKMCKFFGDTFIVPEHIPVKGKNIIKLGGFKELAFLYNFKPDKKALEKYDLREDSYVFVRDIAPISMNYENSPVLDFTPLFIFLKDLGYKILYYPESKSQGNKYGGLSVKLEAPVDKIHSLLYFAKFTISTGDGIARESALLGTPAIYAGGREMKIMEPLMKMKSIIKASKINEIKNRILQICDKTYKVHIRKIIRAKLKKWPDWSGVIVKEITK